jgi:hypothetical protein
VAEWLKAPVLKTGVRETVPGVRIPPSPPFNDWRRFQRAKEERYEQHSLIPDFFQFPSIALGRENHGKSEINRGPLSQVPHPGKQTIPLPSRRLGCQIPPAPRLVHGRRHWGQVIGICLPRIFDFLILM